ncbi:hypothetical protein Lser_V15G45484 [Lactuca serriola]
MKDFKVWRSIIKGDVRITTTVAGQLIDKAVENYTNEDFEKVEEQERALASLTMGLSPDIAQGFREYTSAKALWEALIEKFNMFNYIPRETLEAQLQRFTTLTTEMNISGIFLTKSEINKKLLNALPKSWDINVAVIKKTKDLTRLTLDETMAIIKACDIDDKQREINHVNSYSTTNLGISSNNALSSIISSSIQAFSVQQPQIQTFNAASSMPHFQSQSFVTSQAVPSSNVPVVASSSNTKESDDNLALATGLVNCYNAFVASKLPPQLSFADLDQIHPKDVEKMDITWQIAMAVFREKQFAKKTGKNNWGMNANKKVGFNKGKLRCFNCHEPGHFARECLKSDRRLNNDKTMVAVGNNRGGASVNSETAMVAQSFDWEDQIQALNILKPENVHLVQVNDDAPMESVAADPEEKIIELQFAQHNSSVCLVY